MYSEHGGLAAYSEREVTERESALTLAAIARHERDQLRPEDRKALDDLASCWARKLPRVFRYGALKRAGALRFLNQKQAPRDVTPETHPAFFAMLRHTLRGMPRPVLDDPAESGTRLIEVPYDPIEDNHPFLLVRRR